MKILIDNSNLFAGGGIQVATSFLNDLNSLDNLEDFQIYVIQSENSSKAIDKKKFKNNFYFYELKGVSQKSLLKRVRFVKNIERDVEPNIVFTIFGPSYYKSSNVKVVGFAIPHIVYPSSPYFNLLSFKENVRIRILSFIKSFMFRKNSSVLIFETNDACDIFMKQKKSNLDCYVVNNALNSIFIRKSEWEDIVIRKSELDILYLTANYQHKNINIIPEVIDNILLYNNYLDFKFHLSIDKSEVNFDKKYDRYINYMGRIKISSIPKLYKQMDVLFMPTLLEVFSTSYLEAMFMRVPIVASDMSFARDVCNDAALYSKPLEAKSYAENILAIYSSEELRKDLIKKGIKNLQRFGSSMDRTLKYLEILKKHAK